MKKCLSVIVGCLLSFSLAASVKVDVQLSPAGSFEIKAPRVRGQVVREGGALKASQLRVAVSSLNSGIELRDEHMKEKLKMSEHPQIVVLNAQGQGGKGTAEIEIAGVKKPIQFTYQEKGRTAEVRFKLSLKDFGIAGISYMGVGVQDTINIVAEVMLR